MTEDYRIVLDVKSEEEAIAQASDIWEVDPDRLIVKVLDEEKAFFGLFGRKLRVEVRMEADDPEVTEVDSDGGPSTEDEDTLPVKGDPASDGPSSKEEIVRKLISLMGLDIQVDLNERDRINLSGPDAGIAIGKYGDTIKSMEYLANLMVRQSSGGPRIRLDSDGYRERRESSLSRLANSAAKDALRSGRTVYLDPMTSWERRIVHLALKDRKDVETHSVGVDPDRKVAIRLTQQGRKRRTSRRH
ncbi:single-stranded nucleic acid binding R3H domain protein [Dethiosulfovibrio peptidovorans DSM 11002]|uniref:RNA-binding protein KhpB n=1 Tax=Dethiosulfovibrio peptidovorans DSM 11002 TaxID=469381 RepID=D2Z2M8_9BACT|nr:RNA-binding cell elongation regulator Jag/EloR [Dethiosulfovibrio peptidovorans]EFC92041.1 single-stranded nucleic acid binding R3H domain protein [Dethiosulfovibrio peptidovorans DSM 11002]